MISIQQNCPKIEWNMTKDQYLHIEGSELNQRLHPLWLRERIQGKSFTENNSKQRLYEPNSISQEVKITNFRKNSEDFIEITFSDDVTGIFNVSEILQELKSEAKNPVPEPVKWDSSISSKVERFSFIEIQQNPFAQLKMLQFFFRYGFVHVMDVPTEENDIEKIQSFFGPIKETNFGRIFTVKALKKPFQGLAQTSEALPPHTDLPYKDSMPQIQLLHCLENSVPTGGESILVDGKAVTEYLKETDLESYQMLAKIKVRFVYQEGEKIIKQKWASIIEVDSEGQFVQLRVGTRIEYVPALSPEELNKFYKARKVFTDIVNSDQFQLNFKLEKGMVSIFNNLRLLHARKAYDSTTGTRILQGCYSDFDPYLERLLQLSQQLLQDK